MDRQQFMQQAALRLITGGSSMSPDEVYKYTKELGVLFFPVEKASKPDEAVKTPFHPGDIICYMYRSIIFCDSIQGDCVTSRFEYDIKNDSLEVYDTARSHFMNLCKPADVSQRIKFIETLYKHGHCIDTNTNSIRTFPQEGDLITKRGTRYPVYQLGERATDGYDGYMLMRCDDAADCGILRVNEIRKDYVLFRSIELGSVDASKGA